MKQESAHKGEWIKAGSKAVGGIASGPTRQMVQGVKELVTAWREVQVTHEVETTKREQINAKRDVQIAKIQAQERLVQQYLRGMFRERSKVFDVAFQTLDRNLEKLAKSDPGGDNKAFVAGVDQALLAIIAQIKRSPLEGLNALLQSMEGPDGTIEI